eukprot:2359261-Pyramimonas_sp.AAC.1
MKTALEKKARGEDGLEAPPGGGSWRTQMARQTLIPYHGHLYGGRGKSHVPQASGSAEVDGARSQPERFVARRRLQ